MTSDGYQIAGIKKGVLGHDEYLFCIELSEGFWALSFGSAQVFDNFESNQAVIDHHGIIVATTDAAVHILKDTSSQFVVFFDEFMTASGNKNSPTFAQNMELLRLLLQTHTPVILSSAIPIGRENLRMFDLFGFEVGRVTSCRFNTAWTILASQAPRSGQSATRFKPTMVLRFRKPSYHSTSNISHS